MDSTLQLIVDGFHYAANGRSIVPRPNAPEPDQIDFSVPWNALLAYTFPAIEGYMVVPECGPPRGRQELTVIKCHAPRTPILFIHMKEPSDFKIPNNRDKADAQLRDRFRTLADGAHVPQLHAISAFGTRVARYEYQIADRSVLIHQWGDSTQISHYGRYNILDDDLQQLLGVFTEIKAQLQTTVAPE